MGMLIKGKWHDQWYDTASADGEFIREDAQYRHWITPDGAAGETGEAGFIAEANRYHLYVSLACPWAHRTLIFRELKQLQTWISVSVVHPDMLTQGWSFQQDMAGATGDDLYGYDFVHEIYTHDNPHYSGRVTVPILWDKKLQRMVNNESADIIRMFNSAFNHLTENNEDFYPEEKRGEIDAVNALVYEGINNGVYRAGFATTQTAYEQAVKKLFLALDEIDQRLENNRYLLGDKLTEADWRLFTTLVRFDSVYVAHFKCSLQRIADYQYIMGYLRELYQYHAIKNTVNFEHITRHYYYSHGSINPTRIIPVGPRLTLDAPHGRETIRVR
jgi:putative glutathione S-transferase